MRVLIVDHGPERSSVAAARALAGAGWTVGAGSASPNLAAKSSAVAAWHRVAHTDQGADAFVASVDEVVTRHGYEAVFVGWEAGIVALSEHRDRLSFPVGYGVHAGVMRAIDKEQLMLCAGRAGLATPRTMRATNQALAELHAPVVIKAAQPLERMPRPGVFDDMDQARRYVQSIEAHGGIALVQEQLRGSLIAVSMVAGAAGVVSIAQQVAVHTWPQPVGVTARGVTVPVDETLRAGIERLLAQLQWQGLAQLQFIVAGDGEPRLLDFNPRFYGSIALAIRAGANHPDVWARVTTGRPVKSVTGRPGATYQWFTRDLRASLACTNKPVELARFAYASATAAHSLWSWREPWLAPRFLGAQAGRAIRRVLDPVASHAYDEERNAWLHGLPATPAVRKALRTRRIPPAPQRIAQRLMMKAGLQSFEKTWLSPLEQARRGALGADARATSRLLVRVDEFPYYSGFDTSRFGLEASRRFHAVMAEERVPHLMSVVPQWTHDPLNPLGSGGRPLGDDDHALLMQMREDGVSFAQHGHTHRTRDAHPRRHSELCGLSTDQLDELLNQGRGKLEEVGVHPRILVPPFNRFDAAQWPLLAQRYELITGGPESVALMGFHGGPLWRGEAIYLPCYPPLYQSAAAVLQAVDVLLDAGVGGWIPVVLHMGWEVDDDYQALRRLAKRIAPYAAPWDDLLTCAAACERGQIHA